MKQRSRRQLAAYYAIGGFALVGLALCFLALDYPDRYVGQVPGIVSNVWRERGGYVMCQMKLEDGGIVREECGDLKLGQKVVLEKYRRRFTSRVAYKTM